MKSFKVFMKRTNTEIYIVRGQSLLDVYKHVYLLTENLEPVKIIQGELVEGDFKDIVEIDEKQLSLI